MATEGKKIGLCSPRIAWGSKKTAKKISASSKGTATKANSRL